MEKLNPDLVEYVKAWAETPTEEECPSTDAESLCNSIDHQVEEARKLCTKLGIAFKLPDPPEEEDEDEDD